MAVIRNDYIMMVDVWLLLIPSRFSHLIINIMTEQKGKWYHQGITATESFEYENTRSDFKYCYY